MKKSFLFVLVFLLVFASTFAMMTLLFMPSGGSDGETVPESMPYVFDPYFPADDSGQTPFVNTMTYTLSDDGDEIYVVRTVADASNITLFKGASFDLFGTSAISDVVFVSSENVSATAASFEALAKDPVFVTPEYSFKKTNSGRYLVLDENFTGLVAYTTTPSGHTISGNGGGSAVRVYLPPGQATGNFVFGKASPKPDLGETDESGRTLLQWDDVSAFSVGYYSRSAPRTMGLIAAGLFLVLGFLYLRHRLQMKFIREIIDEVDPDGNDGFRKKRL